MKINKFNAAWQITRLQAKNIQNPDEKLRIIRDYFNRHTTVSDKSRVLNWLRTTSMAYKASLGIQQKFEQEIHKIELSKPTIYDNNSKISNLKKEDAILLFKDLKGRKYAFQFGGRTPKDHDNFVFQLRQYIAL